MDLWEWNGNCLCLPSYLQLERAPYFPAYFSRFQLCLLCFSIILGLLVIYGLYRNKDRMVEKLRACVWMSIILYFWMSVINLFVSQNHCLRPCRIFYVVISNNVAENQGTHFIANVELKVYIYMESVCRFLYHTTQKLLAKWSNWLSCRRHSQGTTWR